MGYVDKPKTAREVATAIVELRRLIIKGRVAELKGDLQMAGMCLWSFEDLAKRLPLGVQMNAGLFHRVALPAERKIEREGWLAQNAD